jgi:putative integral membrane protein (TIGR02587 family)
MGTHWLCAGTLRAAAGRAILHDPDLGAELANLMERTTTRGSVAAADRRFLIGLSRAFGAAIFFSLPLLMTMEMWQLGFYLDRFRVVLFILFILPLLIVLDRYSGFMETSSWLEDAIDGVIAFGVGAVAAVVILLLFNIIGPDMPLREVVGKVALQSVPGGFGAVLANSQFSADRGDGAGATRQASGYAAVLFIMLAGAVFLAFNVAPTEEIVLLSVGMSATHAIMLVLLTLCMMHAFVFAAGFRGSPGASEHETGWSLFLRFTVVGYAVAVLVIAYVLWTFGRFDGQLIQASTMQTVVLALPAGLGAAAARLIL